MESAPRHDNPDRLKCSLLCAGARPSCRIQIHHLSCRNRPCVASALADLSCKLPCRSFYAAPQVIGKGRASLTASELPSSGRFAAEERSMQTYLNMERWTGFAPEDLRNDHHADPRRQRRRDRDD